MSEFSPSGNQKIIEGGFTPAFSASENLQQATPIVSETNTSSPTNLDTEVTNLTTTVDVESTPLPSQTESLSSPPLSLTTETETVTTTSELPTEPAPKADIDSVLNSSIEQTETANHTEDIASATTVSAIDSADQLAQEILNGAPTPADEAVAIALADSETQEPMTEAPAITSSQEVIVDSQIPTSNLQDSEIKPEATSIDQESVLEVQAPNTTAVSSETSVSDTATEIVPDSINDNFEAGVSENLVETPATEVAETSPAEVPVVEPVSADFVEQNYNLAPQPEQEAKLQELIQALADLKATAIEGDFANAVNTLLTFSGYQDAIADLAGVEIPASALGDALDNLQRLFEELNTPPEKYQDYLSSVRAYLPNQSVEITSETQPVSTDTVATSTTSSEVKYQSASLDDDLDLYSSPEQKHEQNTETTSGESFNKIEITDFRQYRGEEEANSLSSEATPDLDSSLTDTNNQPEAPISLENASFKLESQITLPKLEDITALEEELKARIPDNVTNLPSYLNSLGRETIKNTSDVAKIAATTENYQNSYVEGATA